MVAHEKSLSSLFPTGHIGPGMMIAEQQWLHRQNKLVIMASPFHRPQATCNLGISLPFSTTAELSPVAKDPFTLIMEH